MMGITREQVTWKFILPYPFFFLKSCCCRHFPGPNPGLKAGMRLGEALMAAKAGKNRKERYAEQKGHLAEATTFRLSNSGKDEGQRLRAYVLPAVR